VDNQIILDDLRKQSNGICIVVTSRMEADRLNIPVAEYTRAIRELNQAGAICILIEPMGSFYLQVNMLS
jgi:hypothetical protein